MILTETAERTLVLEGMRGLLARHRLTIREGRTVIVGRSRLCHLSVRRSKNLLSLTPEEQKKLLSDPDFNRVSRTHFRITFEAPDRVEIQDLSKNGTFVNGTRVGRIVLRDLDERGVVIRMGDEERLRLRRAP